MMFGLELTTKTEGTEQRVPSRAPPGRRGRKRHVDGVWSGVGAGRGASDRPERHSPVETFRPFRFSRRHSRIPVFDSAPRSGSNRDGSKIRRTFDRALCLVVSAVDEGRMRWTRDSRRRTDNRPAIVGIGKRSPSRAARARPRGGRPRARGILSLEEAELPEGYAPYASQGTPLNSYIHTRTVL